MYDDTAVVVPAGKKFTVTADPLPALLPLLSRHPVDVVVVGTGSSSRGDVTAGRVPSQRAGMGRIPGSGRSRVDLGVVNSTTRTFPPTKNVRAVEFTTCMIAGQVGLEVSGRRQLRRTSGADHPVRPLPYNVADCARPARGRGPGLGWCGYGCQMSSAISRRCSLNTPVGLAS